MRVVIAIESGPRAGSRWLMRSGEKFVFGRSERADIILADDPVLSSCHFRISLEDNVGMLEDLQSTNGTWVNELRVVEKNLTDGDKIRAGNQTFVYHLDASFSNGVRRNAHAEDRELPTAIEELPLPVPTQKASFTEDLAPAAPPVSLLQKTRPQDPPAQSPTPPRFSSTALPSTPQLEIQSCPSGLFRASYPGRPGDAAALDVVTIAGHLSSYCPLTFIVDFGRTKLPPPQIERSQPPDYLLADLPADLAALVSPRMLRAANLDQQEYWLRTGWSKDGMIALCTLVDVPPLLEHFQHLMRPTGGDSNAAGGRIGLCWPSVLETLLSDAAPTLAAEIIEPCEAILVESSAAAGGWALYGDQRLPQLLMACEIPTA